MHDGIILERRGIATGVVVTEPFIGTANAMAALDGNPAYRFAVVPHPTAGLTEAELKTLAPTCAAALETILLRSFGVQ